MLSVVTLIMMRDSAIDRSSMVTPLVFERTLAEPEVVLVPVPDEVSVTTCAYAVTGGLTPAVGERGVPLPRPRPGLPLPAPRPPLWLIIVRRLAILRRPDRKVDIE